ncbi:uncharacterized protein LOC143146148 [Ptiloglossa arizonensis]|uniref:uncharacterized protein LOC143146148 n=1 Tax=Ptiloglossa arizonensis TaxID=3350558 RepID=UPI003FA0A389
MAQPWHFLSHLRAVEAVSCSLVQSFFFLLSRDFLPSFDKHEPDAVSPFEMAMGRAEGVAVCSDAGCTAGRQGSYVLVSTPFISLVCKLYRNQCLCNFFCNATNDGSTKFVKDVFKEHLISDIFAFSEILQFH